MHSGQNVRTASSESARPSIQVRNSGEELPSPFCEHRGQKKPTSTSEKATSAEVRLTVSHRSGGKLRPLAGSPKTARKSVLITRDKR